jgi:hypothetical protein
MGVLDRSRNDLTDAPADNRKDPTSWKSSSDETLTSPMGTDPER